MAHENMVGKPGVEISLVECFHPSGAVRHERMQVSRCDVCFVCEIKQNIKSVRYSADGRKWTLILVTMLEWRSTRFQSNLSYQFEPKQKGR